VTEVKLVQLTVAQWDGDNGLTYTLYALDSLGQVYRMKGGGSVG